jgi:hypothetical protein
MKAEYIHIYIYLDIYFLLVYICIYTEWTESVAYKQTIAPFRNDMPVSDLDGFKRDCDDHNYAYIGSKSFSNHFSRTVSWEVVPLPETIYPESYNSKNNPFKGLIIWRWDTKLYLYISEGQFILISL